jgi:hypothetical protein
MQGETHSAGWHNFAGQRVEAVRDSVKRVRPRQFSTIRQGIDSTVSVFGQSFEQSLRNRLTI